MQPRQDPKRMEILLARRERQGLTWSELSRRSGLPVWKLRWWQRRLSPPKRTPLQEPRPFVPVQIVTAMSAESPALDVTTASGVRIRVPAGFDADHLRRLLRALAGAC